MSASDRRYAFDDVVVDTASYRVYKAGELCSIGPRAFDVLLDLIAHRDRVVTKDELFDRVWRGVAVTDNALTRAVKDLRHAIGDDARSPKYVETASRRGYRFVAALAESTEARAVSVLVLPFDDLSDAAAPHLTDGLVGELIATLGRVNPDRLAVIGHASAIAAGAIERSWAESGRRLGVDVVVEGTVRRDERRVQVSIRIGRVADEATIWTRTFEAGAASAPTVDARLAESIASQVHVELAERRPPAPVVDPDAHAALLEGRHFLRQRTADAIGKAQASFERALARSPGFARAHAGLAHCHAFYLQGTRPPADARARALAAVTRALELDDRLAEAHAVLAVLQCAEWRFADAERSLRWAVALDPASSQARHWLAMFPLAVSGRYEEALDELRRARRIDPLSLIISADIAGVALLTRQFDRAVTQCTDCLHLDPHFARAHLYLGMARAALGRHDTAVIALETAARLDASPWTQAWLGYGYGAAGRQADARALLAALMDRPDVRHGEVPFFVGVIHAGLGEIDRALEWFEHAVTERSFWVTSLGAFPAFDGLRSDPRFVALIRHIRDTAWPPGGPS